MNVTGHRTELACGRAALTQRLPVWVALADRAHHATPFHHPAWVMAWLARHPTCEPRCAFHYDGTGRLIGVLPLVLCPDSVIRPAGYDLADMTGALVGSQEHLPALWRLALAALREHPGQPGRLLLNLPVLAPADEAALRSAEVVLQKVADDEGATLALPDRREDFLARLPASRLRDWRRQRRKLEREHGPLTFEVRRGPDVIRAFCDFRDRAWRRRGRFHDLAPQARGRALAPLLSSTDQLASVPILFCGRTPVAMSVLLATPRSRWYYLCAFDPAYSRYSPGSLLLLHTIEDSIARGYLELNLGRGTEPYKFRFGATLTRTACVTVTADRD